MSTFLFCSKLCWHSKVYMRKTSNWNRNKPTYLNSDESKMVIFFSLILPGCTPTINASFSMSYLHMFPWFFFCLSPSKMLENFLCNFYQLQQLSCFFVVVEKHIYEQIKLNEYETEWDETFMRFQQNILMVLSSSNMFCWIYQQGEQQFSTKLMYFPRRKLKSFLK